MIKRKKEKKEANCQNDRSKYSYIQIHLAGNDHIR
jgi:hypothetical protein